MGDKNSNRHRELKEAIPCEKKPHEQNRLSGVSTSGKDSFVLSIVGLPRDSAQGAISSD